MWRSSTQSANHAKQVLENHKKALATGLKPSMPQPGAQPQRAGQRPPPNQSGNPFLGGIVPPTGPGTQSAANNISNAINT